MNTKHLIAAVCFAFLPFAVGCGGSSADNTDDSEITIDGPRPAIDDVHDHPSEGPHHGTLVELGSEEYHAEVVHDDRSVTVYILDASATKPVAIEAAELTINLTQDGSPEQFKLAAAPDEGDAEGKSSRFTLADAELVGHLDDDAAAAKLMVTIAGTPYRGEIKHDHEHHGHDHAGHQH